MVLPKKKPRRKRTLASALFVVLALSVGGLLGWSWSNNQDLEARTDALCRELEADTIRRAGTLPQVLEQLEQARQHGLMLDLWEHEGVPMGYGFGLYRGAEQLGRITECYREGLGEAFVAPARVTLEERLRRTTGARHLEAYNALKAYLLLRDREHLEDHGEWLAFQLRNQALRHWALTTKQPVDKDPAVQEQVHKHLSRYVKFRMRGDWQGEPLDDALVAHARKSLQRNEDNARYYDEFVTILEDEQADPNKALSPSNLKFPPITLRSMFSDRPKVLRVLVSKRKRGGGRWQSVTGPYTPAGYKRVRSSLDDAKKLLQREAWVGVTDQAKMEAALDRVWSGYQETYVVSWQDLIADIELTLVKDRDQRKAILELFSTEPSPYETLLRTVAVNTQVGPTSADNPIRKAFASFVALGAGEGDERLLRQYATIVKERLDRLERGPAGGKKATTKRARELLAGLRPEGRKFWTPLLFAPLGAKVDPTE